MPRYVIRQDERKNVGGRTLYRIALSDSGESGGYIEAERNLAQNGTCWVHGDSVVYEDAHVSGDAQVLGEVFGSARVSGSAVVQGRVYGRAVVRGNAQVFGQVFDDAIVEGAAQVYGNVYGQAHVSGNEMIYGNYS